jgi:integrase
VLLSLLTGARKANVLSMRWDEINFERGTWNIPETKNGDALTLPLIPEALEILNHRWARKKADDDKSRTKSNTDRPTSSNKSDDYVLPGEGARGHLASPQKGWQRILQRAQLHYLIDTISAALQWSPEEIAIGIGEQHVFDPVLGKTADTPPQIAAAGQRFDLFWFVSRCV